MFQNFTCPMVRRYESFMRNVTQEGGAVSGRVLMLRGAG
ncbi:hypothetical protein CHELA41_23986 [Hyphomicrobiales bacterium]|nr:hypothetical protein CHELA41_23986 [Hyphomicrobiales bacterium]